MEKSRSLKRTKSGLEYIERLTHYFTANDIEDEDKQSRFYSVFLAPKRTS